MSVALVPVGVVMRRSLCDVVGLKSVVDCDGVSNKLPIRGPGISERGSSGDGGWCNGAIQSLTTGVRTHEQN